MLRARPFRTSLLFLLLLGTLCSCARDRTLCAYADSLAKDAHLADAADAYAAAQRADEGHCADEGLDQVAKGMAEARTNDAKGRAAARAGDTAAAKAAFEAALR